MKSSSSNLLVCTSTLLLISTSVTSRAAEGTAPPAAGPGIAASAPGGQGGRGGGRTAAQDRQEMMDLLGIKSLRPTRNGSNPQATNYANYDEATANPYPKLPEPLVLKNGQPVTTPAMWWNQRRPEIVEDFDREIYGRVPSVLPKVTWEVTGTSKGMNGDIPIVTKQIVGHVDNSAYPAISVNIGLSLTLPEKAAGPSPVLMVFGAGGIGGAPGGLAGARGAGALTAAQQAAVTTMNTALAGQMNSHRSKPACSMGKLPSASMRADTRTLRIGLCS